MYLLGLYCKVGKYKDKTSDCANAFRNHLRSKDYNLEDSDHLILRLFLTTIRILVNLTSRQAGLMASEKLIWGLCGILVSSCFHEINCEPLKPCDELR